MKHETIDFFAWVKARGGTAAIAERLGVTERAVRYWVSGQAMPRSDTMRKLIELSEGQLTYQSILESTDPKHMRDLC